LEWFKIQRSKNIPISGPILQEKATEFGKRFNKIDFQCSSWITRFHQRHNIVFGKISGESSSVPVGVSENWLEHVWRVGVKIMQIVIFITLMKLDCFIV